MSKFAIGEKVDKAADDHEGGIIIAVFPTADGNFRYAVDMESYGALQFFAEEKLVVHAGARAFSSEVDTGSREENASNQKIRARF